ncbi:pre-mRNA-processing factor 40, putative [Plasmodium ovale]|uniref:Pre-mRNA-processing factor 40, putative n=1 Tax=Plasmodium ovale TaxID=36330 RepID=A0A1D3U9J2_PLAOA|nr:pre-mRNA-processing factor 40, putative [Plasmodium ovale]
MPRRRNASKMAGASNASAALNFPGFPNLPNMPGFPGLPGMPGHAMNNPHFMGNNPMGQMPMPFMPGLMPNMNPPDFYGKNLMHMNPGYDNYNPLIYGQHNSMNMLIHSNGIDSLNDVSMHIGNPNMIKLYNDKEYMLNSPNKSLNNNQQQINLPNDMNATSINTISGNVTGMGVVNVNYMNNFNVDNHGWCEMVAKNGRKYYYNSITKCSKWEKPDELKSKVELRISQQTKWKEYSCSDGRKYWHHEEKNISLWDEPEEIKKIKLECAAEEEEAANKGADGDTLDKTKQGDKNELESSTQLDKDVYPNDDVLNNGNQNFNKTKLHNDHMNGVSREMHISGLSTENVEETNMRKGCDGYYRSDGTLRDHAIDNDGGDGNGDGKQKSSQSVVWTKFENKNEAREHLKLLFEEKNINPKMTWENTLKVLESDSRWQSLVILTKGEKKQMFSEYVSHAVKRAIENERRKKQKSRELIFQKLLCWDKLSEQITYVEFASEFYNEEWWNWITEKERDEIFQDFLDEYRHKFKEDRRKKRKKICENLKEKFQEYANMKNPLKWNDVKVYFKDDEDFNSLHKIDALATWESFYEKYYNQEKMELKKKVFRILRKKRDSFIELLNEYHQKNILNMKTQWIYFVSKIYKDVRYTDLLGQQGSSPKVLFEEFIDSLQEQYLRHKSYVKSAYKELDCSVDENTTFDQFLQFFTNVQKKYNIPETNMNCIYLSLQKKLKEKKSKEVKHINKVAKFLTKIPEIKPFMTYSKVISIAKNSSKWPVVCDLCPKEEQKLAAYNVWKSYANSKKRELSIDSSISNSNKNLKHPRTKESLKSSGDDEYDEEEGDGDGDEDEDGEYQRSAFSKYKKYSREDSDSSAQTIESLRTIDHNVSS